MRSSLHESVCFYVEMKHSKELAQLGMRARGWGMMSGVLRKKNKLPYMNQFRLYKIVSMFRGFCIHQCQRMWCCLAIHSCECEKLVTLYDKYTFIHLALYYYIHINKMWRHRHIPKGVSARESERKFVCLRMWIQDATAISFVSFRLKVEVKWQFFECVSFFCSFAAPILLSNFQCF